MATKNTSKLAATELEVNALKMKLITARQTLKELQREKENAIVEYGAQLQELSRACEDTEEKLQEACGKLVAIAESIVLQ